SMSFLSCCSCRTFFRSRRPCIRYDGACFFEIFSAAQIGTITGTFFVLLLNGFVGFQLAEDGTSKSVWVAGPLRFSPLGPSRSWCLLQASLLHCLPFSALPAFPTKQHCRFLCFCSSSTQSPC